MSVSAMVETYDMPMVDYNEDGDIPMGGSSENWFQPLPHMDEDVLHVGPFSDSQEVDMMAFEETTTEYEMTDELAQPQDTDVDTHVVDAEVYDVTFHPSPAPSAPGEIAQSHSVPSGNPDSNATGDDQAQIADASHPTLSDDGASVEAQHFVSSDTVQAHDGSNTTGGSHTAQDAAPTEDIETHEHRGEDVATEASSVLIQRQEEVSSTADDHSSLPSEHVAALLHSENSAGEMTSEVDNKLPVSQIDNTSLHEDEGQVPGERDGDEDAVNALQTAEESAENADENAAGQSEPNIVQQVYLQPPPSIFLSLQVASAEGDQPDFVLFSYPDSSSHATEEPLLLLQHRPSLFYEPVSAVFDAFRQEEYFSHLEELSEAEMALNAHELQLVISEDNIYSREVSLQDLHAMHQGVGLPGHLKLTLQSIVPRFITRYNHLRDHITRLVLGEETGDTRQHEGSVADEGEAHEPEVHSAPDEAQEGRDQSDETEGQEAVENEDVEAAEQPQEVAAEDLSAHPDGHADRAAAGTEDGEGNATDAVAEGAEDNVNDVLERHEDGPGETDDAADNLDASDIHSQDAQAVEEGAEPSPDERDTEYSHEAEPHEEGDEGYGYDFEEDGGDGTGTTGITDEITALSEGTKLEARADEGQHEPEPERDEAQAGQLSVSRSTTTSSFDADESSWEDAAGEIDDFQDVEDDTNQSIQQTTATVFDEEGNLTDGVDQVAEEEDNDFGDELGNDEFGDEDFEESAEGTLEDPNEEPEEVEKNAKTSENVEKDADAASREVLAESEDFLSKLENEIDAADTKGKTASGESDKIESHDDPAVTNASSEVESVLKNASKRSLDDAELDKEATASPSGSPDSKRTRKL